jgi:hypothetical protein
VAHDRALGSEPNGRLEEPWRSAPRKMRKARLSTKWMISELLVIRPYHRDCSRFDKLCRMLRTIDRSRPLSLAVLACLILGASLAAQTTPDTNWPYYGGDSGGMRYSPLTQFNPENVSRLKIAWVFHTGILAMFPMGNTENREPGSKLPQFSLASN